ncbi:MULTISPECIES: hypothetical protein [unclassified Spirosoma]|uniref:hypothetical protein n=1 Tax=unclassified Spirosoma TaxID=2621999 RepID=UPI0009618016|nr:MULTISPECIES: hypothetical protein [unclassified Spirosoma]MBN8825111.1 hypothetical protein [Spirosoma sp.]OJW77197.1 MAG: hypothetical protein BGO59_31585 [Spirosoma sp. 48-14]
MSTRKALIREKVHYEALISANLLEVKFRSQQKQDFTAVSSMYTSGMAYKAAHLEVSKLLNN